MISTGRGGAGNIHSSSAKASPKIIPQGSQTPSILHPVYSTGRGGAGNMRKNVDPKLTRRAQDVEEEEEEESDCHESDCAINDENDNITPIHVSNNTINAAISNVRSTSAPTGTVLQLHKSRTRRSSSHEIPKSIAIGRGGAGNILSPSTSMKSLAKGSKHKGSEKSNKKKNWYSFLNIFSQQPCYMLNKVPVTHSP